ncbi:phosphoribosyltransferase [Trinickia sp.]|uniref:phosphoribosyltransferase n=1 Tax=Trinickia sp. TaxID=2571163 RepID=UPI003F807774
MFALYKDRAQAGRVLAEHLRNEAGTNAVVLALPRGGVPVAFEVATALHAELDVLPVRKIGVPGQKELAMGAIASGGALYVDHDTMRAAHVSQAQFDAVLAHERVELARREALYRGNRPPASVEGRTVLLVDDGIATGATMRAAVLALRARRPKRIIAAVPVAPEGVDAEFAGVVDAFICPSQPTLFFSVGQHYEDFGETTDDDVRALLHRAWDGAA